MNENIAYLIDDVLVCASYRMKEDDQWDLCKTEMLNVLQRYYEFDVDRIDADYLPGAWEDEEEDDDYTLEDDDETEDMEDD